MDVGASSRLCSPDSAFLNVCGWLTMWGCVRSNSIGNTAALSVNVCFCSGLMVCACVCVYVYVCVYNSQLRACRCAAVPFWKGTTWEPGSLRGWRSAHVQYACAQLFLFISSQHLCLFPPIVLYSQYGQHVRASELCSCAVGGRARVDRHVRRREL